MVQGVVVEDGFILDVNPASGELIEKVPCSTPSEVVAAVAAARAAQPAWHELGLAKRHDLLVAAVAKIRERGVEALAELITKEMGKVSQTPSVDLTCLDDDNVDASSSPWHNI
jgi:acyl-CoA reductase-like NAD-dependent aldehyde dehydrogenase